jgi:(2R)-sulfolactate sulfo-lyase subunit alpha
MSPWNGKTENSTQGEYRDDSYSVGVAVVEDIEAGMALSGWVMDTDETITLEARDPIPLGHKVALQDIAEGDTVYKYGHDIGRAVQSIAKGHHVHVHNTKTKRW